MPLLKKQKTIPDNSKKQVKPYLPLIKLFLILTILLLLWIIIVGLGATIGQLGPTWAILNLETWGLVWIALTTIFFVIELLFFMGLKIAPEKNLQHIETEILYGKKVYEYTYPENIEEGLFSKTYIPIDNDSVLRLRQLLTSVEELFQE